MTITFLILNVRDVIGRHVRDGVVRSLGPGKSDDLRWHRKKQNKVYLYRQKETFIHVLFDV